jgi:hypothetical protein
LLCKGLLLSILSSTNCANKNTTTSLANGEEKTTTFVVEWLVSMIVWDMNSACCYQRWGKKDFVV